MIVTTPWMAVCTVSRTSHQATQLRKEWKLGAYAMKHVAWSAAPLAYSIQNSYFPKILFSILSHLNIVIMSKKYYRKWSWQLTEWRFVLFTEREPDGLLHIAVRRLVVIGGQQTIHVRDFPPPGAEQLPLPGHQALDTALFSQLLAVLRYVIE